MFKKKVKKIKLCSRAAFEALEENKLYPLKKEGYNLLYFKHKGACYVFKNKCPHQGYAFDGGYCSEAGKLVCPIHQYGFDIENGRGAGTAARKYESLLEGDTYYALVDYVGLF